MMDSEKYNYHYPVYQGVSPTPGGAVPFAYGPQMQQMDPQLVYGPNSQFMHLLSMQNQSMYGGDAPMNRYPISPAHYSMVSPQSPYMYVNPSQQQIENVHDINNPYIAVQTHISSMSSTPGYMPPVNPQQ